MKQALVLVLFCLFTAAAQDKEKIVLLDNFDRPADIRLGNTPTEPTILTWIEDELNPADISIRKNKAVLYNKYDGYEWAYIDLSKINGYPLRLSESTGKLTWSFNFRQTAVEKLGFDWGNYGIAFVLAASSSSIKDASGYAVVIGNKEDPDTLRLVSFKYGLDWNMNLKTITGIYTALNEFITVKVVYDPDINLWSLYAAAGLDDFLTTETWFIEDSAGPHAFNDDFTRENLNCLGIFYNQYNSGADTAYFDDIYITDFKSELPVELISFKGSIHMSKVLLEWTTATEINNYGFFIEAKFSDSLWITRGFIPGYGNSSSVKEYKFEDKFNYSETVQYRLKQVDNDGSYKYSNVLNLTYESVDKFKVQTNYPNPFNNKTIIEIFLPLKTGISLIVYNTLGEVIQEIIKNDAEIGNHKFIIDAGEWNSGVYFYTVRAGNSIYNGKLMLLK